MQAKSGRLTGKGEIRDKDGNVKATFEIDTECTPAQAEQLNLIQPEESEDGDHAPD